MKTHILIITIATLTLFHPKCAFSQEEFDPRAVSLFLKGTYAEARYDLFNAFRFYSAAEHYDRGNLRIRLKLASVSLRLGDLESARKFADPLLEVPGYESEALLIMARISEMEGDTDSALVHLNALLERDDIPRFEVLRSLSMIYLKLERIDDARVVLEETRDLFSADPGIHLSLGYIYSETEEFDLAIESFEKALALEPGNTLALLALASVFAIEDRVDEAVWNYQKVLDQEPSNAIALRELSGLFFEEREFEKGIELLEPRYHDGNLDSGGKLALGRLYYRADREDEALAIFKELLLANPNNTTLLRIIAEIEVELHHFKTAYSYLRTLVRIEPDDFSNYVGLLLIVNGVAGEPSDPSQAITIPKDERQGYLEMATSKVDRTSADETFLLGAILRQIGELEQAGEFLLKAERLSPDDRRILMELAAYYERESRFEEAITRVVRVYEMDPEDASVLNFYGYLLAEKGDRLDFAEELLNKALGKEPENGYFLDSLAWIKYQKGEYERALELLMRAVREAGDDPVIWDHLGQTYEKLGSADKAVDAYRKSLEEEPDNEDVQKRLTDLGETPAEN